VAILRGFLSLFLNPKNDPKTVDFRLPELLLVIQRNIVVDGITGRRLSVSGTTNKGITVQGYMRQGYSIMGLLLQGHQGQG
jgi:hypothetical protein